MRQIPTKKIADTVNALCLQANTELTSDVEKALKQALKQETSKTGREILQQILENAKIARKEKLPICQDCGLAFIFIEIGQEVKVTDGSLTKAINDGVKQGYKQGYLRKSTTSDPLTRENPGTNLPAMVHTEIVPGNKLKITVMTKGGGAENCSAIKMFKPTSSKNEIDDFIVATVKNNGANACPPLIIGVGIGGSFDQAPLLAKKSLLRKVGSSSKWEKELLNKINRLGIGPMGLGGKATALTLHLKKGPCHISSLPVAINIECHAHRVKSTII